MENTPGHVEWLNALNQVGLAEKVDRLPNNWEPQTMKVLVTGAAGYIGWAVVHELLARGDELTAVVHRRDATFPSEVVVHRGVDVADETAMASIMDGVEGVCHLAGLARARLNADHPMRYFRTNIGGTVNVLEAMSTQSRATGQPGSIVFASTSSVYGQPTGLPIKENAVVVPSNPYAASKLACEHALSFQSSTGTLGATTLRIFNAAGAAAGRADSDRSKVIPAAVAAAAAGRMTLLGDGTVVRDFVHVQDVARAFALALHGNQPGQHAIYNIGGVPASVRNVIASTERITGRTIAIDHRPGADQEAPTLIADTSFIKTALGWTPRTGGLDELILDQWSSGFRPPGLGPPDI